MTFRTRKYEKNIRKFVNLWMYWELVDRKLQFRTNTRTLEGCSLRSTYSEKHTSVKLRTLTKIHSLINKQVKERGPICGKILKNCYKHFFRAFLKTVFAKQKVRSSVSKKDPPDF